MKTLFCHSTGYALVTSTTASFITKFKKVKLKIEGLRAKRAYIAFLANFHFLQDRANFWQTDLF